MSTLFNTGSTLAVHASVNNKPHGNMYVVGVIQKSVNAKEDGKIRIHLDWLQEGTAEYKAAKEILKL